jgi:HSP20 family protein
MHNEEVIAVNSNQRRTTPMLMRFDPFADFDRLSRQMWGNGRAANYMPADAYRKEDRLFIHIDLPGIDPDTIDVTVEKNTLTVSAERSWEIDGEDKVILNERPSGTYTRQFFLGESLDTDSIEAGYDHGVLTVSLPIAEQAKARKIAVSQVHDALTG